MGTDIEKRKFQRLEFPLDVAADILTATQPTGRLPLVNVKSRNISKAGICLETETLEVRGINLLTGPPYAREHRLLISIDLIAGEPPFSAIGEVRWYRKLPLKADHTKVEFSGIMHPGGSDEEGTFYGDADNWHSQRG